MIFMLALSIVLGSFVRLAPVLGSDFPLNDGGMFYAMIQDIQQANYHLPAYTSYNAANIPFAYPPLPFYLGAVLSDLFGWSLLGLLRILPAVVASLTVPAFYLLGRAILQDRARALVATYVFAMLPGSFGWLIMGGGLTRSLGYLFALLTLQQVYLMHEGRRGRHLLLTIVFASLTVLSHPDASWFAACGAAVLMLFYGRSRRGITNSLLVAAGVLLVTAPWWGTVVSRHGVSPLTNALQTSSAPPYHLPVVRLVLFSITPEVLLDLGAVLGLLGVLACVTDRKFFLPVWLVAIMVLDPRSASRYATIPLAMLAETGLCRVILPGLSTLTKPGRGRGADRRPGQKTPGGWFGRQLEGMPARVLLGFVIVQMVLSATGVQETLRSPLHTLPKAERQAMKWIGGNVGEDSRFLLITADRPWAEDAASEWFPVLASRSSLATVQGLEWLPDGLFGLRSWQHNGLQACATEDVGCLEAWAGETGLSFTHVYVSKTRVDSAVSPLNSRDCCSALRESLNDSSRYDLTYDGPGAAVFALRPAKLARSSG